MDVSVLKIQLEMRLENMDHGEVPPPERALGSMLFPRVASRIFPSVCPDFATRGDGYDICNCHVANLVLCGLGEVGYIWPAVSLLTTYSRALLERLAGLAVFARGPRPVDCCSSACSF